jgi:hypothetical protein
MERCVLSCAHCGTAKILSKPLPEDLPSKRDVRKLAVQFVGIKPKMIFEILLKVGFQPGTLDAVTLTGVQSSSEPSFVSLRD